MTVLPLWRKNPDADFSLYVDDPHVFRFIEEISENQQWLFTFAKASEIAEVLRTQLSVLLKNLLDQKRAGQLDTLPAFRDTTAAARQIALERPKYWEFLLTVELLRSKLSTLRYECTDFDRGLIYRPKKHVAAGDFLDIMRGRMSDPITLVGIIKQSVEHEIPESWGPEGQPGNPIHILRAVDRTIGAVKHLLEWEIEITALEPPERLRNLGRLLTGMTSGLIAEMSHLADEIETAIQGEWTGVKQVSIKLVIPPPPQLEAFTAEMEEIKQHPEWLVD